MVAAQVSARNPVAWAVLHAGLKTGFGQSIAALFPCLLREAPQLPQQALVLLSRINPPAPRFPLSSVAARTTCPSPTSHSRGTYAVRLESVLEGGQEAHHAAAWQHLSVAR